jgi:hypothetical protein
VYNLNYTPTTLVEYKVEEKLHVGIREHFFRECGPLYKALLYNTTPHIVFMEICLWYESHNITFRLSRDSSLGTTMGYELDCWASIPGRVKFFPLRHGAQTVSWAH